MESGMKLPIGEGFKLRIRSYFSFSRSPYSLPFPRSPCPCSQFLILVTPNEIESVVVPSCPLTRNIIQGDRLIQVSRNTVQRIRSPVMIRSEV